MTQSTTMAIPATAAEPARPRTGASARAKPPKHIPMKPTHSAKPIG